MVHRLSIQKYGNYLKISTDFKVMKLKELRVHHWKVLKTRKELLRYCCN